MLCARLDHLRISVRDTVVTKVSVNPQLGAQIVRSDQQNVDTRHRRDPHAAFAIAVGVSSITTVKFAAFNAFDASPTLIFRRS